MAADTTNDIRDRRRSAYSIGIQIFALPLFVLTWVLLGIEYGWPGVLFGWFPAALVSLVGGMAWPLVILAALVFAVGLAL